MKAHVELIKTDLRLALRDKAILFFSYLFPLIFFFAFAELFDAGKGGAIAHVVSMVLLMGILGNGLFGAGMRTVHDRENQILRRFKVAPIGSAPILTGSLVTGWILYLPAVFLVLILASVIYGMKIPDRPLSFLVILSLGLVAFRAIGLILASVANSMQEVNILVQIFYTPMLFLSGALFPISVLPNWVQLLSQYLPATYLVTGLQGIFLRDESLLEHWLPATALLLTAFLGVFISRKLFRWEKEEKVAATAKLWVLAVIAPFVLLGTVQLHSQEQIRKAKTLYRELKRSQTLLIEDARIFIGDGRVLERGSVLIRKGKIDQIWEDRTPEINRQETFVVHASGKTLLPGLIDSLAYADFAGGDLWDSDKESLVLDALASQLYCGVTTVRYAGIPSFILPQLQSINSEGIGLGAELLIAQSTITGLESDGPLRTQIRGALEQNQAQAISLLLDFTSGVGWNSSIFPSGRQFSSIIAVVDSDQSLDTALRFSPNQVLFRYPDRQLDLNTLRDRAIFCSPFAGGPETIQAIQNRETSLLERSLIQQISTPALLDAIRRSVQSGDFEKDWALKAKPDLLADQWLVSKLYRQGLPLVAASQAGQPLIFPGPGLHRELQLWQEAGIPAHEILSAATFRSAQALGLSERIGLVAEEYEANLLLVDGNPLDDVRALERISLVVYRGERIDRSSLLGRE